MTVAQTDYYELLGIPPDADEETIRKAFHTRARECHPETADSAEAGRRFRELAEAYDVLSNRVSQRVYDGDAPAAVPDDGAASGRATDICLALTLDAREAARGTSRLVRYDAPTDCDTCDGTGMLGGVPGDCPDCDGTGVVGAERVLLVRVPGGIDDGDRLRVAGEGAAGGPGVAPGDLVVDVEVVPAAPESPLVRYLAIAALLLAVTLLVAYLLLA